MSGVELVEIAQTLGVVGLLVVAVLGGFRRWYVWAWQYTAMEKDRDFWRELYLRTYDTADKAIAVAVKNVDRAR